MARKYHYKWIYDPKSGGYGYETPYMSVGLVPQLWGSNFNWDGVVIINNCEKKLLLDKDPVSGEEILIKDLFTAKQRAIMAAMELMQDFYKDLKQVFLLHVENKDEEQSKLII